MAIQPNQPLGLMGSNSVTGENKPLAEVKEAFCEVHPSRRVAVRGPSIGRYHDSNIPAWIEMADGARYDYAGTCGPVVDFSTLAEGQLALAPGLIYQPVTA